MTNKPKLFAVFALLAGTTLATPTLVNAQTDSTSRPGRSDVMDVQSSTYQSQNVADSTRNFVKKAAIGNQFEVDSSRMAIEKSENADLKKFAQMMIDDHGKAQNDLQAALRSSNLDASLMPDDLDSKHRQTLNRLRDASGNDFDRQYVDAQNRAHDAAISLFSDYAESGNDPALKSYAEETLPTLRKHKDRLGSIAVSRNPS